MHVISKDQITQPFVAPLGEQIYELIGSQAAFGGSTRHSFAHVLVPPGKLSPQHYHRISEESYYILKGRAHMVVDAKEFTLEPGQSCLIKTGEVHQVFNRAAEDLEFLVVCAPPWTPEDSFAVEDIPQQHVIAPQKPAVTLVRSGERTLAATQTPGMIREEAFHTDSFWSGIARTAPGNVSNWHHHAGWDTVAYVLEGALRVECGRGGTTVVDAHAGDYVFIPKGEVHRERNPADVEQTLAVVRMGSGPVVTNVDGPLPE